MFDQSYECPMGKNVKESDICKGCRKDGTLKQECAGRCPAYKKYLEQTIK